MKTKIYHLDFALLSIPFQPIPDAKTRQRAVIPCYFDFTLFIEKTSTGKKWSPPTFWPLSNSKKQKCVGMRIFNLLNHALNISSTNSSSTSFRDKRVIFTGSHYRQNG